MRPEKIIAVVMLISLTLGAGLQVDRAHLFAVLKNVGLLARALLANFVIVPILGVILARLFRLPEHVAAGFLLMAIAPGVPFILAGARKKGGRLSLAVELAIVLPLLSIVTVPITAAWVLPPAVEARLPLGQVMTTLVLFQLLPLLIGIAVGTRWPAIGTRLARPLQFVFFAAVAALFVVLGPKLVRDVATIYGSNGILAMLCLVLLSMAAGWLLGGPAREDRRILGMGTLLRNIGLAAAIATASLGTRVESAVLTYLLIQIIVSSLIGVYFTRTAKAATA